MDKPEMKDTPKLVWLDLETTGLVPAYGQILEVGIIVTELDLTELDRKSWVFPQIRSDVLGMMDDYVLSMHVSSGLLKEVWFNRPGYSETYARDQALKARECIWNEVRNWLRQAVRFTDVKLCYLAGSSIHFDKSWLQVHFEELLQVVSYRMLDVSSYKVAFPDLLKQPELPPAHRVLDDLEYSIDQHRQMLKLLDLPIAEPQNGLEAV